MKQYTFEGYISTMSFSQSGTVIGYGNNEDEARQDAVKKICNVHRIHPDCVKINKLVSIKK